MENRFDNRLVMNSRTHPYDLIDYEVTLDSTKFSYLFIPVEKDSETLKRELSPCVDINEIKKES